MDYYTYTERYYEVEAYVFVALLLIIAKYYFQFFSSFFCFFLLFVQQTLFDSRLYFETGINIKLNAAYGSPCTWEERNNLLV